VSNGLLGLEGPRPPRDEGWIVWFAGQAVIGSRPRAKGSDEILLRRLVQNSLQRRTRQSGPHGHCEIVGGGPGLPDRPLTADLDLYPQA
jgi:hypothetical protein